MQKTVNILMGGVGGQGVILASEVLALAAIKEKPEVKQTEVHGVAQRGGSVSSYVRYGEKVYSPIIRTGEADLILAFEKLEAVRFAHFLRDGGTIIVNDEKILPGQIGKAVPYPDNAVEFLRSKGIKVMVIPATQKAEEMGNPRVASLIMLGAASTLLDIKPETWDQVISERIPPKLLAINQKAFAEGKRLAAEAN